MKEKIVSVLRNKELDYTNLRRNMKISESELNNLLSELMKEGTIFLNKRNRYTLVSKTNLVSGIVKVRRNGSVIVSTKYDGEVEIINKFPNIITGDSVLIDILPNYKNNIKTGKIVDITSKYIPKFIGEVVIKNNSHYVSYKDELIPLYGNDIDKVTTGYMIIFSLNRDSVDATLESVVGHKDEIDKELDPYVTFYGFKKEFPEKVVNEVENISLFLTEEKIKSLITEEGFVDLRYIDTFTIDGAKTKDIDDAVSIIKSDNRTTTLITSIAMPAYYIKRGTYTFYDILERGTSAYPDDSVIPMCHPRLSNEICSLNEESDRLALSYFVTIDELGNIKDTKIVKSIIRSRKKMTYDAVNSILEDKIIPLGYEKYVETLENMNELSKKLENKMKKDGFLDFYSPEVSIIKENGNISFEKKVQRSGEKLIENFMLTTNEAVTTLLTKKGLNLMYRVHEMPNIFALNSVMNFICNKYNMKTKKNYSREDIIRVLKFIKGKDEEKVLSALLIRCQSKARFDVVNKGHYATAKKIYGMQTSPIRRGEDFVDQAIILDYLDYGVEYTNSLWEDDLEDYAMHFNNSEKCADKLENDVLRNRQANYLKEHIGKVYDGVISMVCNFGFFVEIDEMYEGLVNSSSLNGIMKLIPESYMIVEKNGGYTYTVGDKITVKISGITDENKIDFELVGERYENKKEKGRIKKKIK